ncbi:RNA polymerase sigma-70 factor (ECF subfamily) [Chitinophaga skermanii]|uniref:RNA polymerase sigma-70 factor (ECF subfamily) n=1 Tax=Chitinophaga skermanii TaxID=331697 RepID=A0A327QV28_9BACT|nr:RNA polymerase sigma-70 factor (ECF subfamily) [Chitinophaga skermanii]
MAGLQSMQEEAFKTLHGLYYRQLCYYTQQITQQQTAAEDIATDTFIKLLEGNFQFATLAKLKSFMFTVAHNAALDFIKSEKRHQLAHEEIEKVQSTTQAPYEYARIQSEALQAVYHEIEQLPTQCREVIRLSFINGMSIQEIAAHMGIAYKTVQNQKARGLQLVRNALIKKSIRPELLVLCLFYLHKMQA